MNLKVLTKKDWRSFPKIETLENFTIYFCQKCLLSISWTRNVAWMVADKQNILITRELPQISAKSKYVMKFYVGWNLVSKNGQGEAEQIIFLRCLMVLIKGSWNQWGQWEWFSRHMVRAAFCGIVVLRQRDVLLHQKNSFYSSLWRTGIHNLNPISHELVIISKNGEPSGNHHKRRTVTPNPHSWEDSWQWVWMKYSRQRSKLISMTKYYENARFFYYWFNFTVNRMYPIIS